MSNTLKEFKHYLVEFDSPQIYCDMDGVLADFDRGIRDQIGGTFDDSRWIELPDEFYSVFLRDGKAF